MTKKSKVPSGFYTGTQAAQRLGIPITTFYDQVRKENIELKKVIPPGARRSKEGYFIKEEVDKLAQARELFTLLYSVEKAEFSIAQNENDIRGIVDLCVAIYGTGGTPNYDTRLKIWRKSPMSYYVLKQEDIVVGYSSLIWFNDVALEHLMQPAKKLGITQSAAGSGVYSVTGPENIVTLTPGQPIDSLFISLGTRPGMSHQQQRNYGFRTVQGTIDVIADFHRQGMPVRKLLATSERQDGIILGRKIGMREIKYPGDPLLRYEMDLEHADTRIAKVMRGKVE
jgi:hypothetical protein